MLLYLFNLSNVEITVLALIGLSGWLVLAALYCCGCVLGEIMPKRVIGSTIKR